MDSYAVDAILISEKKAQPATSGNKALAGEFLEKIRLAKSECKRSLGSGWDIETRTTDIAGSGVGLSSSVVHYAVQISETVVPGSDAP